MAFCDRTIEFGTVFHETHRARSRIGLHNLDQYGYPEGQHEKVVLLAANECVFLCNQDFDAARLIPETLDGAVQVHLDEKMPPVLYQDGREIYCPFGQATEEKKKEFVRQTTRR